tara:strand:- start:1334 stop:2137 length:804 start_codon:yes stop_codon:yes gene_type:complete
MFDLVDSHCHLDFKDYCDDFESIIERAKKNNIKYLLSISIDLENFKKINLLTKKYNNIWCTTGIHPNNVDTGIKFNVNKIHDVLSKNIKESKVIGLGETGLDKYRDTKNIANQLESFDIHLKLSGENNLPTIVHTRSAEIETIQMLKSKVKNYNSTGLIHCFSSTKQLAKVALDNNFYISIAGIITFKNAYDLRDIVKYIPLEKLLVETDSPYLAPVPFRGKRNEPSYVKYVVEKIAEIKRVSFDEVAKKTTDNFLSLFKKIKPNDR